jgi:hypothetical protein
MVRSRRNPDSAFRVGPTLSARDYVCDLSLGMSNYSYATVRATGWTPLSTCSEGLALLSHAVRVNFATVCLRTAVTKGLVGGGRNHDGLQNDRGPKARWRGEHPHCVALVRKPARSLTKANCSDAPPISPRPHQPNPPTRALPEIPRREAITHRSLVWGQRCEQRGADGGGTAGDP